MTVRDWTVVAIDTICGLALLIGILYPIVSQMMKFIRKCCEEPEGEVNEY